MKQEAHEILKKCLTNHRDIVLSGKSACIGIMKDYGGREHQEINLLAEALEEKIPERLERSQPVTEEIITALASQFAAKKFYTQDMAVFTVQSWANALGFWTLDINDSYTSQTNTSAQPYIHTLSSASREHPFTNTLHMKFVPVPGTNVLFSIWDTRVQDYHFFVCETCHEWRKPEFEQGSTHPVVNVSWDDAKAFCGWLTERERKVGRIGFNQEYRLPTDEEWSKAVGLPTEQGSTPKEKDSKIKGIYPWGTQWPPPQGAGNYTESVYVDFCKNTSPVGFFLPNCYGLYDMGGNVWEWCEDWYDTGMGYRVGRGAPGLYRSPDSLLSSIRSGVKPGARHWRTGFRCVLASESSL